MFRSVKLKLSGDTLHVTVNHITTKINIPEDDTINPALNFFNNILIYMGLNPNFFPSNVLELSGDNGIQLINYLKLMKIINNNVDYNNDILTIKIYYKVIRNILGISINGKKYFKVHPWDHNNKSIINGWNKIVDIIGDPKQLISEINNINTSLEINEIGYKAKDLINYLQENFFLPKEI
jgi:hypothetical protein